MKISMRLIVLPAIVAATFTSGLARADNFCQNWAAYLWDFEKQTDASADSTWSELSAMNERLAKGRRLAAVGSVSRADAAAYPSIPSAVETGLDEATQQKVRALYEKYVLVERRIEDMWKDKYRDTESSTSMQRFSVERDQLVGEMNKIAHAAKAEFERYGLRVRDCFPEYEQHAQQQVQTLNQALASANTALKFNEGVWAHAYPSDETTTVGGVPVQPQVSGRAPASGGEPAITPDSDPLSKATQNSL